MLIQIFFFSLDLILRQMTCRTVKVQRKRRMRSAGVLTAVRHIAVLPCQLVSFQDMAPGLAVIIRIPAA